VGFYNADADRDARFDDYDVRQAAYWSLLAGACGHTYGHNSVWQMWQPGRKPVIWASTPWHEALDHPGASQMKHVRHLFESRPFHKLVPDQSILLDAPTHGGAKVRAARATDGSFVFVYSPRGEPFTVRVNVIRTSRIRQTWYDPRTGAAKCCTQQTPRAFKPSSRQPATGVMTGSSCSMTPPPDSRLRDRPGDSWETCPKRLAGCRGVGCSFRGLSTTEELGRCRAAGDSVSLRHRGVCLPVV
jgi:hypothetical protein